MKLFFYLSRIKFFKTGFKGAITLFFVFCQLGGYSQCNQLVWADEFSGSSIDASKWTHEVNGDGGGNGELQYYTDFARNSYLENDNLIIKLIKEDYLGKSYTSARLVTRYKASWQYGRFEVRAKIPAGLGTWPAIWMLPDDQSAGWPGEGEIDIMEHVGSDPGRIHGTVHTAAFNHLAGTQVGASTIVSDFNTAYHVYAVEWTPTEVRWFIDDVQYHSFQNQGGDDKWPFDKDFHFILNVAMGGAWGGAEGIDETITEVQMDIDYCRVYSGTYTNGISGDSKVYENDNNKVYTINAIDGAAYNWSLPAGASIATGQGTNSITVNWGTTSGNVNVDVAVAGCSNNLYSLAVVVEAPVTLEYIFEDFEENRNLNYILSSGTLTQTIANPNPGAPNSSALVGKYDRNIDELYDVIFTGTSEIGNASEFSSGKRRIQMDVYTSAPIGTKISMQLENSTTSLSTNYPTGRHSVYEAYTTIQNGWETIEFDYLSRPDGTVGAFDCDNMVLLVDANSNTDHTLYFDNVASVIAPDKDILNTVVIADYDAVNELDTIFANGIYNANVSNPAPNELNGSALVASYVRDAGSPYDVISFATNSIEDASYFKSGDYILFVDVYSSAPIGTDITISFENAVISENDYPYGRNSQYTAVTTATNSWETLMFTFATAPDAGTSNLEVNELAILFGPNSNTGDTYYIDNFRYGITIVPDTYAYDFTIQNYDGVENLSLTMATGTYNAPVATPAPNAVNNSANVAQYIRSADDLYDVIFMGVNIIDDASVYENGDSRFACDIYTEAPVGTIISWQLENSTMSASDYPSGRHSVYQAAVQASNEWHTLEFSYSSSPDVATPDNSIDQMVLLVNPNSSTDDTYYFDNFRSLKKGTVVVNNPPVASAGVDQNLVAGTTSTDLKGSFSTDPNSDPLSFEWSQLSGPNAAVFSSVTVANPGISNLIAGVYAFELNVSDGEFNDADQVVVTVESIENTAPIANAGDDQILLAGSTTANLNGSASTDPDGDALTFSWSQVNGPNAAVLSSETIANPDLSSLIAGDYTLALTVSDGELTNTDQVVVTVESDGNYAFIPGVIQAEDWSDMFGVQTESTSDIGGGLNVGWIDNGDWMDYAVNVTTAGTYTVDVRVAAAGTAQKTLEIQALNTASVEFTATNSWQGWITASTTISLDAGEQTIRLYATSTGLNVNWIEFSTNEEPVLASINLTPQNTIIDEGATQQFTAVGVDQFGDAIAFTPVWTGADVNGLFTASNAGTYTVSVSAGSISANTNITVEPVVQTCTKYEAENWANMSGVQTEGTADVDGGLNVGWINTNDWIDINVYAATAGNYTLKLRGATPNGPDVCQVQVDYVVAGQIDIANTGGWQTWDTFETTINIPSAGNHAIRLLALTDGFNINWIELCGQGSANTAPIASLVADSQTGTAPLLVTFDASASTDADGDALTYAWEFGDGSSATGVIVQHTYTVEGDYAAVVIVSDGSLSASANTTISVTTAPTDCLVDATNGDFSVEVSSDPNNPTLTFIPAATGTGDNLLLLYYGTSPNGPYPGYMPAPNEAYQINAAAGETVYFYYTYSLATGGENNSAANKNSFVVGQCETTLKAAEMATAINSDVNNIKVYPNPVEASLNVDLVNSVFDVVSLIDVTGQEVWNEKVENKLNLNIDFTSLNKGVYMLVLSNDMQRKVVRIIKQ
jgi:beta-glucanase (GH16 family)